MSQNLLFELGSEELPPKALKKLAESLADNIQKFLIENQFIDNSNALKWFATPRRIAVLIDDVASEQPRQVVERRGPSLKAAYDDNGNPSKATQGFMRSLNIEDVSQLDTLKTDQGEWLYYKTEQAGKSLAALIEEGINAAIKKMPIAKRMRWADLTSEFVRPVKWILLMHGNTVLPCHVLGINSANQSKGHRFHANQWLEIKHADEYESVLLEKGKVVADYQQRKSLIEKEIQTLAKQHQCHLVTNENLLEEVTSLVELPNSLLGKFDAEFLKLPKEVLISSMQDHQKYFSLVDNDNKLAPYFITVSNIKSKQPERVIQGNERVIRARLADAQFFWQQDQKTPLIDNYAKLAAILFHHKLGSVEAKVKRLSEVAKYIVNQLSSDDLADKTELAAKLIKADLVTGMVAEFPELQGIIGRYYADAQGVDKDVAAAIEEHYLPKQAGGSLPQSDIATAMALADKLDTIAGIFIADEIPTGDKDPFALRRHALGVLRILIEKNCDFSLHDLVEKSISSYYGNTQESSQNLADKTQQVSQFIRERLKNYYQTQDINIHSYLSVAEVNPDRPLDFDKRIHAVEKFRTSDAADSLASANKRIRNILEKSSIKVAQIDKNLLLEPQEISLVEIIDKITPEVNQQMQQADYFQVLQTLSELKEPIDKFFDDVKVMDDDEKIKANRLAILHNLRQMFVGIADISYLIQ